MNWCFPCFHDLPFLSDRTVNVSLWICMSLFYHSLPLVHFILAEASSWPMLSLRWFVIHLITGSKNIKICRQAVVLMLSKTLTTLGVVVKLILDFHRQILQTIVFFDAKLNAFPFLKITTCYIITERSL